MKRRIEDYALIGDCHTAGLVSKTGSIDWLCLPRFDSPAVFAALVGNEDNGYWRISPTSQDCTTTRKYRDGTLVLETSFKTETGTATVIDFMPTGGSGRHLTRIIVGQEGEVKFDLDLTFRFDYGRSIPWVEKRDASTITATAGPDLLVLRSGVDLHGQDMRTRGRFVVKAGDRQVFSLTHQASHLPVEAAKDDEVLLGETEDFWTDFSSRCPDLGEWTDDVKRSLITLKALTYQPTGGIVAAATTSLPERIGGERNWDYRYCWLRDSSLTLMAFMELGFYEEAAAWRDWLMRAVAGDPAQTQIMYGVAGERQLVEWEVPWLEGFEGSKPVRVGNAASDQFQLDVYGEVAEVLFLAAQGGLSPHPRQMALSRAITDYLEKVWREPDDGIWEVRGGRQQFVHSKIMAWVAFDRAAKRDEANGEEDQSARYRKIADEIHAEVCSNGYDETLDSFVQFYSSKAVDASLLLIPLVGFLPAKDPRVVGTVRAIETRLLHDGLARRYDNGESDDGLSAGAEGTFLICSFMLADVYAMLGRRNDAITLFERLRSLQNDVGLMAEEYDPASRRMLGNFPQAFSHVGFILSALNLSRSGGPAREQVDNNAILA